MSRQWVNWLLASALWLVLVLLFVRFFLHSDPMGTPHPLP